MLAVIPAVVILVVIGAIVFLSRRAAAPAAHERDEHDED